MQPLGSDSYTSVDEVQAYLNRDLTPEEQSVLAYVIPAASRWIDNALGTSFDKLPANIPFGQPGSGFTQLHFRGGYQEISIRPCQQIVKVEAINPYDFSVWYLYSTPLEYIAEPYDYPVKRSLRMKMNEFTGKDLKWPGDEEGIQVTALFTEYDYVKGKYPDDIRLLCNHIAAVWLQNNQNTEVWVEESVEGHRVQKSPRMEMDILDGDPMVKRVLAARQEVWLEDL